MSDADTPDPRAPQALVFGGVGRLKAATTAVTGRSQLVASLATKARHEVEIEKLFEGRVRFSGEQPVIDAPLVIVGFTNRSGSTLLTEYLKRAGAVGALGEEYNHFTVAKHANRLGFDTFPAYVEGMWTRFKSRFDARDQPDRRVGFKASADQVRMLYRWNIPAMFAGGVKLIAISRADRIAQGVSFSIASQTQQWSSDQRHGPDSPPPDPEYRPREIARFIKMTDQQNALMDLLVSAFDIDVFHTSYENLSRDPTQVIRAVARFVDQPCDSWTAPVKTRLKKQATSQNVAFADRFRHDLLNSAGF